MLRQAFDHPKIKMLAADLGIDMSWARGIAGSLWLVTGIHHPDGAIGRWDNRLIASAVGYSGDAEALVQALIQNKLLDHIPGTDGRLYVHDWHDHCDDHIHMSMARKGRYFANGTKPKMSRLSHKEREACTALFEQSETQACDLARTCAHHGALPEPEPEPVPEPEPGGVSNQPTARTIPPPAPKPATAATSGAPKGMDGKPLVHDADFEAEGKRWFQCSLNALVSYHRTEPSRSAKQAYCNAFERHVRAGHQLTVEAVQQAADRAVASWRAKNLAGAPRSADPVIAELAALINPLPPSPPNANGGPAPLDTAEPPDPPKLMDSWTRQGIVRQLIRGAEKENHEALERGEHQVRDEARKLRWDEPRIQREISAVFNEVLQHARDFTAQDDPERAKAMRQFVTRYRSEKTEAQLCPRG